MERLTDLVKVVQVIAPQVTVADTAVNGTGFAVDGDKVLFIINVGDLNALTTDVTILIEKSANNTDWSNVDAALTSVVGTGENEVYLVEVGLPAEEISSGYLRCTLTSVTNVAYVSATAIQYNFNGLLPKAQQNTVQYV